MKPTSKKKRSSTSSSAKPKTPASASRAKPKRAPAINPRPAVALPARARTATTKKTVALNARELIVRGGQAIAAKEGQCPVCAASSRFRVSERQSPRRKPGVGAAAAASDPGALADAPVELVAYELADARGWTLEPAPVERAWMEVNGRHAYRCLPMTDANADGWVVRCPVSFVAEWVGDARPGGVRLTSDEPLHDRMRAIDNHFGNALVTFHLPWLFRTTAPGYGLRVGGLPNFFKFNASPCEGNVRTDFLPFTFTMNWKLHRTHEPVQFVAGDPICFLQLKRFDLTERAAPRFERLADHPELLAEYRKYDRLRAAYNADPKRRPEEWQRIYHGATEHLQTPADHRTKVKAQPFAPPPKPPRATPPASSL